MKSILVLSLLAACGGTSYQPQLIEESYVTRSMGSLLAELPDYRITGDLREELCSEENTVSDCQAFERDLNRRGYTLEQFEAMGSELPRNEAEEVAGL